MSSSAISSRLPLIWSKSRTSSRHPSPSIPPTIIPPPPPPLTRTTFRLLPRLHLVILHMPIPILQRPIRTPQPSPQLVQKQPRILPPQKILQHLLRLPTASLDIHRLQNRHYILE